MCWVWVWVCNNSCSWCVWFIQEKELKTPEKNSYVGGGAPISNLRCRNPTDVLALVEYLASG